jgi:pilus assembly protein Flp/PilA
MEPRGALSEIWPHPPKLFLTSAALTSALIHSAEYLMSKFIAFLKNESGATAIEYGLIAAGISIAIIAVVNTLGTTLNAKFKSISDQLK